MSYYAFVWADGGSSFQLLNSEVRNNKNMLFYCIETRVEVTNTTFSEIVNTIYPLIFIRSFSSSGAELSFTNAIFE